MRIDSQHRIAGAFSREMPIDSAAAVPTCATGAGIVRFVTQVKADYRGVAQVAFRERDPIVQPCTLRILTRVTETVRLSAVASFRAMVIKDDSEPNTSGISYYTVENLQRIKILKIGVDRSAASKV